MKPQLFSLSTLIALFIVMGIAIIFITPYGQFPDEDSHFNYARYLRDTRHLPPMSLNAREMPTNEGFQPPLYYMVAAVFLLPDMDRNVEIFVLRFLSLSLATVSVLFIFKIATLIFPKDDLIPVVSTAVAVFNPQYLYINCGINSISMMCLTGSVTIYCAIRMLASENSLGKRAALLGLSFGAALLTRTITVCLLAVCLLALLMAKKQLQFGWGKLFQQLVIFGLVAFAVSGWWYVYNWIHYGDLLAWRIYVRTLGEPWVRTVPFDLFFVVQSLAWLHAYFWIYFGNNTFHAGITEYVIYLIVEVIAVIGLWHAIRSRKDFDWNARGFALLLVAGGSALLEILALQFKITSPQGRYLYMAIPSFAICIATGLLTAIPDHSRRRRAIFIAASLCLMWAYVLFRYWLPHYV